MKTETQIAQENIRAVEILTMEKYKDLMRKVNREHKVTCQRFLEFLEELEEIHCCALDEKDKLLESRITDLKQAIKLYEEAGI